MHIPLTSKYGSRVLLATYRPTTMLWFASLLEKKSDHSDKLLSTEATFGFCLLYLFIIESYTKYNIDRNRNWEENITYNQDTIQPCCILSIRNWRTLRSGCVTVDLVECQILNDGIRNLRLPALCKIL